MSSKWLIVLALVGLTLGNMLSAAPTAQTTITVPDMHCMGCAKKMAAKLYEVPGVANVQANVQAVSLVVAPKAQQGPSPRAMWEAVEKAGYKPSRLEGPGGTFTTKPQS